MTKNGEIALVRRGNDSIARRMEPLEDFVTPAADIFETPAAFVLKVDLPGVEKGSISVVVETDQLTVKGLIGQLYREPANLVYSEIRKASFYRRFRVGSGVDQERIQAGFQDGVLTLTLPKNDSTRVREIPIK
ncbi:MAG TPA: Hsp20/alpha crystallin family protein [Bacteroidota bacterium]|nr:Hsp20/alpha crystallin family protein [Bacteroidota bacterium]